MQWKTLLLLKKLYRKLSESITISKFSSKFQICYTHQQNLLFNQSDSRNHAVIVKISIPPGGKLAQGDCNGGGNNRRCNFDMPPVLLKNETQPPAVLGNHARREKTFVISRFVFYLFTPVKEVELETSSWWRNVRGYLKFRANEGIGDVVAQVDQIGKVVICFGISDLCSPQIICCRLKDLWNVHKNFKVLTQRTGISWTTTNG